MKVRVGVSVMKQKIILFIVTSIIYALTMRLFFMNDNISLLKMLLVSAIIFGLLTTVILSIIQWINQRRLGLKKGKLKVNNTVRFEIEASKQEVFEICEKSLVNIKKCIIEENNLVGGTLTAKTGVNWQTWGDYIFFQLEFIDDNKWMVNVSSRPIVKTTVIDYGKNKDNIRRIIEFIRDINMNMKIIQDDLTSPNILFSQRIG